MPYKRGQVVRLIRPITEIQVGEDHGSSVWASCGGLSGYVRTSNIETTVAETVLKWGCVGVTI